MKAALTTRYGGPEVVEIGDIARPEAKPGEVLVQVHAASLTLPDCAMRKADPFIVRFFSGLTRPKNPIQGDDFSGVVIGIGAGVTRFAVGDTIFGSGGMAGAHAQVIALPESSAMVRKPDAISHVKAAGLSYAYLTAMPFMRDEARLAPGMSVLINGASSSIGLVAIQLARHFGAEVTGVCSTRNVELVRSVGAQHVIDHTKADFTEASGAYDVVFDAVGKSSLARCRKALKAPGLYLTTVPSLHILGAMLFGRKAEKRGKLATTGLRPVPEKLKDLEILVGLVESGAVRAVTDRTYRLDQIVDAYRYVETERKAGDVVITMPV